MASPSVPKPEPTPAAPKADEAATKAAVDEAAAQAAALQKRRRGRAATILTQPQAIDGLSRGTLLGGGGATA